MAGVALWGMPIRGRTVTRNLKVTQGMQQAETWLIYNMTKFIKIIIETRDIFQFIYCMHKRDIQYAQIIQT